MHLLGKDNLEFLSDGLGYNYDYEFQYLHTHDYWEFIYVIYPIIHNINGSSYQIDEPSILIIKPEDNHAISAVAPPVNPKKYPTVLNLKITEKALARILLEYGDNLISKMHSMDFTPKKCSDSDIFDKLIYLKMLPYNPQNAPLICSFIKTSILSIVLRYFPEIAEINTDFSKNAPPDEILQLTKKLSSPAYFNRKINEITKNSYYSTMQLTRLFKKHYSMTMNNYFLFQKLQYAKTKLQYSEETILKIATDIGMTLPHFDSFFKQKTGKSPLEYRKDAHKITATSI